MDYYVFLLLTLAITLGAQSYLNSTYNKSEKIRNKKGLTGEEVARRILDKNGLKNVSVVEVFGTLSDHYDPKGKVVRLSTNIFRGSSIASCSVAAHECGHAIQDKVGYVFLRIRSAIIPLVNFASMAGYIAIMIGLFAGLLQVFALGIVCEVVILLFQLITLPVEFNASSRGLKQLSELNLIEKEENSSCRSMLRAAALTYVASVATSIVQIIRLILMVHRRD